MSIPQLPNRHGTRAFPAWLSYEAPIAEDLLDTASSELLLDAAEECLPLLIDAVETNSGALPSLKRAQHVRFLRQGLEQLPSGFAVLDASRPWVVYWCLMGLALLGVDVAEYRERVITTFKPLQNKTGGFGGGNGQYSHLATTYAALLSLAIVGGSDALGLVDREAMWKWLGRLKQPQGDFAMSENGERDMRAPYCALTAISLLNLPLQIDAAAPVRRKGLAKFADKLPEWIGSCQTFEGGISSAPGGEAHGSYVFCALACLCILGEPSVMMRKYLDLHSLVGWLTARQIAPEGGLAGRTNKVVDGCYSHWIGGCWSLVEAAVAGPARPHNEDEEASKDGLFDREALIRYILCCCQGNRGGLRDKPSKSVDSYHSCYNLAGLSSAQNQYYYYYKNDNYDDNESCDNDKAKTQADSNDTETGENASAEKQTRPLLDAAFNWRGISRTTDEQIFREEDRVALLHPVFVLPQGAAEQARAYFASRPNLAASAATAPAENEN